MFTKTLEVLMDSEVSDNDVPMPKKVAVEKKKSKSTCIILERFYSAWGGRTKIMCTKY